MIGLILAVIVLVVFFRTISKYIKTIEDKEKRESKEGLFFLEEIVFCLIEGGIILYALYCLIFGYSNSINDPVVYGRDAIESNYLYILVMHPILGLSILIQMIQIIVLSIKSKKNS